MSDEYTHQVLRISTAQILDNVGYTTIKTSAFSVLIDILHRYLKNLTRQIHDITELGGRTEPNLEDVALAFQLMKIDLPELKKYVEEVEPVRCTIVPPTYPVRQNLDGILNLGKERVLSCSPEIFKEFSPSYGQELQCISDVATIQCIDSDIKEENSACSSIIYQHSDIEDEVMTTTDTPINDLLLPFIEQQIGVSDFTMNSFDGGNETEVLACPLSRFTFTMPSTIKQQTKQEDEIYES